MRMRDKATSIIEGRSSINEAKIAAVKHARIEDGIREAQLRTRIRMLEGRDADVEQEQLSFEKKLNFALYRGIEKPTIKIDVVGVVILSSSEFSKLVNVV